MDIKEAKIPYLNRKAEFRAELFKKPDLIYLFFELTRSCNEKCFHCGSSCAPGLVSLVCPIKISALSS